MNYADLNGDGEVTPGEIIEENNYYPFGLKHQGYNELAGDAHKYKFLNREHQPELGYNTIATDYRHYDAALGRFNNMDALSELAPNQTPYRYGFNNPVYWTDPTGLFETWGAAQAFALEELKLKDGDYNIEAYDDGTFVLNVTEGEFDGRSFYFGMLDNIFDELVIQTGGSGRDQSGEGEGVNWAQVNHGVNVFGFSNAVKIGLINDAVVRNSGLTAKQFRKLDAAQKTAKTVDALGDVGSKYLRSFRGLGTAAGVFNVGYSLHDMRQNGVNTSNTLDLVMAGVSFIPGWGQLIGGAYFITNYLLEQHTGQNLGQHIEGYFN